MANLCVYNAIVKGRRNACYAFYGAMPDSGGKEIVAETGTDELYSIFINGDCKWEVDYDCKKWDDEMPIIPDDWYDAELMGYDYWCYTVKDKSKIFNVEVLCNSADVDDYYSHREKYEHYNNGEKIKDKCPHWLKIMTEDESEEELLPLKYYHNTKVCRKKNPTIDDHIFFGSYEQDGDKKNGKERIEWRILDIRGDRLLVMSEYAIDCQPFHNELSPVNWETSSIRKWLNADFIEAAFSDEERMKILTATIPACENPEFSTENLGNPTQDKVFLLGVKDVEMYLYATKKSGLCRATEFAVECGAIVEDDGCYWWLRTPGEDEQSAVVVTADGQVGINGTDVDQQPIGIRPALWLDLNVLQS